LNNMPEIVVEINLFDNPMPPKDISHCLGLTATKALLKGEENEKRVLPRGNLWVLASQGGELVEEEWYFLREKLRKSWQQLIEITRLGGTTKIVIVVRITERIPPLYMPADMIKEAAELGAIIDIECYDYR